MTKKIEPKNGEFWVVSMAGEKEVVQVHRHRDKTTIYPCGGEEGWDAARKDIKLKWVRKIRL